MTGFAVGVISRLTFCFLQGFFMTYCLNPRKSKSLSVFTYTFVVFIPNVFLLLDIVPQPFRLILNLVIYYVACVAAFSATHMRRLLITVLFFLFEVVTEFSSLLILVLIFGTYDTPQADLYGEATPLLYLSFFTVFGLFFIVYPLFIRIFKLNKQDVDRSDSGIILVFCGFVAVSTIVQYVIAITNNVRSLALSLTTVLIPLLSVVLMFWSLRVNKKVSEAEAQTTYLKKISEIQSLHTDEIKEQNRSFRQLRHDFDTHMHTLSTLMKDKKYAEAENYLLKFGEAYSSPVKSFCNVHALDAVLYSKYQTALNQNIDVLITLDDRDFEKYDEVDLCSMFANLLQNAIEACVAVKKDNPSAECRIHLKSQNIANYIVVAQSNTSSEPLRDLSTNKDDKTNHGIGLVIIEKVAAKYNGSVNYEFKDGVFFSTVKLEKK